MSNDPFIFPAEIQARLLNNGRLHQALTEGDAPFRLDFFPVVKLILPGSAAHSLLTQIDPADHDRAFGLYGGNTHPWLGSINLSAIAALRGPTGAPVTWDAHFIPAKSLTPTRPTTSLRQLTSDHNSLS